MWCASGIPRINPINPTPRKLGPDFPGPLMRMDIQNFFLPLALAGRAESPQERAQLMTAVLQAMHGCTPRPPEHLRPLTRGLYRLWTLDTKTYLRKHQLIQRQRRA